jgi:hypothetical protein
MPYNVPNKSSIAMGGGCDVRGKPSDMRVGADFLGDVRKFAKK